jgi:hypothetical protein
MPEGVKGRKPKRKQTPWAVLCPTHGQVFLTDAEYDKQMDDPETLWTCPICGERAEWDDDNYEVMAQTPGDFDE